PDQVEQVVGDLEGDPQPPPVAGQALHHVARHPGVVGAEPAAAGGQLRRLAVYHVEVLFLTQRPVAAFGTLLQLADADAVGRRADDPAGGGVAGRAGQVEGVREQEVTQEDADLVAPAGVDGGDVAADAGAVEHVVVDERGGVDHLDDGGQRVVGRRDPAPRPRRQGGAGRAPRRGGGRAGGSGRA